MIIMKYIVFTGLILFSLTALAQQREHEGKFEQLDTKLRTANVYRTASGAPGSQYWQQQADYDIDVELDEENHRIIGSEKITYTNNSPDDLPYLWLQLDQNMRAEDSDTYSTVTSQITGQMTARGLQSLVGYDFDGGHKISAVTDSSGNNLPYTINKTMMRVDLPEPLRSGESITFQVDWSYNINDRLVISDRGGYETFPEDGNTLYTITQWFPRMAVYSDYEGWAHKQFLGSGEFALPFGDYKVRMTVPADHIVASTGVLQNPEEVLTEAQRELYEEAKTASSPVIIVSQDEVEKKEKRRATDKKTWIYQADSVRDFAWGSSRKFIWDAMGVDINGKTVMAMSYYPKEANPLYEQYSTEVVAHTLEVYSEHTIAYPYPVAISVEASNGMEYPMICFNYGRPEEDGTYTENIKYGMISVIIHEVGHNFFPMIINSNERQWTWMDEGLNTFVQYLAEQEWDRNYPSRRGPAAKIVPYMKGSKEGIRPIMTNSEQILQFGANAYAKPATALNILRETIMGRELFDFAFKTYSERWAFKHPTPDDLFRTMEDASGIDLDWFWKGWFYSIDNVNIAIADVEHYQLNTQNPEVENPIQREADDIANFDPAREKNEEDIPETAIERNHVLRDFYNSYDEFEITAQDRKAYEEYRASLSPEEREMLDAGLHFYEVTFRNVGGLVMPLILQFTYADGTTEITRIPAEIWRKNETQITKVFVKTQEVESIVLDPFLETADTNIENNYYPERDVPSRFELFKQQSAPRGSSTGENPMQKRGRD